MAGVDILKVTVKTSTAKKMTCSSSMAPAIQDDDNDGFADGPIADADCDDETRGSTPTPLRSSMARTRL